MTAIDSSAINRVADLLAERDVLKKRAEKAEQELIQSAGHTCKGAGCSCRYGQALARAERAEAACAEMRAYIELPVVCAKDDEIVARKLLKAELLSNPNCGQGWLSPDKAKLLITALENIATATAGMCCHGEWAQQALTAAKGEQK